MRGGTITHDALRRRVYRAVQAASAASWSSQSALPAAQIQPGPRPAQWPNRFGHRANVTQPIPIANASSQGSVGF